MSSDYRFGPSWGADTQLYNDAQIKRVRDKMLNKGTTMPNKAYYPGEFVRDDDPRLPSAFDTQEGGQHYKDLDPQPAQVMRKWKVPHLEGEAIYRILRHERKNGAEDIRKAIHTLELILELDYAQSKS